MATPNSNLWTSSTQLADMELRQWAGKSSTSSSKEKSTEEEFFDSSMPLIQILKAELTY